MIIEGMLISIIALAILFAVVFVILVVIVGTIIGITIVFFPAVVAGLIVWFLTGSFLWGGAAFVAIAILMLLLRHQSP
jgi:hypothetical protein